MAGDDLSILSTLLAVAEERSFTRAAKRLGVSPSAVSHAMRGLEERLGVRLLARTTRSVAPTEAGEQLLARLRPALTEVRDALGQITGLRDTPAGRVRLLMPRFAVESVLAPKLAQFAREYPDILLDVTTDDSRMDIVAGGFDAGIHLGEYIAKDMRCECAISSCLGLGVHSTTDLPSLLALTGQSVLILRRCRVHRLRPQSW